MENNTIEKLSDAITQLMDAYEQLQEKNTTLEEENDKLNTTIGELESKNETLKENLNLATNSSDKQSSKMSNIMGKIESVLSKQPKNDKVDSLDDKLPNLEDININKTEESHTADLTDTTNHKSSTDTIDLNRMESLLKGM